MATNWYPEIIQGGMGVNISNWFLARLVSTLGQLGTVSGVALERILVAILQRGDQGGHVRRALNHFPFQDVVKEVLDNYFVEGGATNGRYKNAPMFTINPSRQLIALVVCANFAFVWLAKERHNNPVSINYLEKIQMPHIYAITGAMLAGVDYLTMGAGIALQVPEVIKNVLEGQEVRYRIHVEGEKIKEHTMCFNPKDFFGHRLPEMRKPMFLPIIASNLLAKLFTSKLPDGSVYGFVVEEPTAGGHNAPPRTPVIGDDGRRILVYGSKDEVDYDAITKIGLPFWIGGGSKRLSWAKQKGAKGIQAGSIFALCNQSGMEPGLRQQARRLGFQGELQIRTDMRISPTGFPFKVACIPGTLADKNVMEERPLVCNQGALVTPFEKPDGSIGYRCPSEATAPFLVKGGRLEETEGRGCVCNGLLSTCGMNSDPNEPAVVTLGDNCDFLRLLMKDENDFYNVADAIKYLLSQ